jgi:hypothetical protein
MMVKPTLAVAKPAETGILVRALAGCLKAATAVLSEQPTGNHRRSLDYHPGATRVPSPAIDDLAFQ